MENKNLYTLLYGIDGCSGFIGTIRMEDEYDETLANKVKEYLRELVNDSKRTKTVPANDVAALSDMLIDLTANADMKKVEEFLNHTIVTLQELYED